jgi:YidC/Oxa1 family membrane protein insertase
MSMEKRVFIAIFLCFVVLAIYQATVVPPPAPPPATTQGPAAPTPASQPSPGPATAPQAVEPAPVETPVVPSLVGETAPREVIVETDSVRAVFSTEGATLRSWQLKHYLEDGQPLELVPMNVPPMYPRPFTIATNDAAISQTLATALFRPSADSLRLGSTAGTLSFEYRDASGLAARKTFHFQPEGKTFLVKVEAAVDQSGVARPVTLAWGPALGRGYEPDGSSHPPARAILFRDGGVDRFDAGALEEDSRFEGNLRFAGVEDQYFLSAVVPGSERITVEYTPISLPIANDAEGASRTFVAYTVTVPGALSLPYFLGPKDFDVLRAVDAQIVRAIDFGIFAWLCVPLLQALKWINGFVSNYGWSIVVLTILINLAIFPLRHRSMVSMKKMQALQPEMKAIQERYAKFKVTDPERQKMNQEMMGLYKQKGVNPVSGCVPMLLTLPILFAFYSLLSAAIELRGAPFLGWIQDLSRHDPLYVTPILMGATQFLQMKMMPSTADPIQQKIFMLMPIIFTVSFLWAPSGLVLYWLLSNVLAIGQQALTNRLLVTPVRPAVAARTRVPGNAGGGKT